MARRFNVLRLEGEKMFRVHQADPSDATSMAQALQPQTIASFITTDEGKRMRLTAFMTVLEEARTYRCDTAIVVDRNKATQVIRKFGDHIDSLFMNIQLPKVDENPIRIMIRESNNWKTIDDDVSRETAATAVTYYMSTREDLHPYDWEGNPSSAESCFNDAQREFPPTIYLCTPNDAQEHLDCQF